LSLDDVIIDVAYQGSFRLGKEHKMSEKRRDSKNRILRSGESQRKDGKYAYKLKALSIKIIVTVQAQAGIILQTITE